MASGRMPFIPDQSKPLSPADTSFEDYFNGLLAEQQRYAYFIHKDQTMENIGKLLDYLNR